MTSGTVLNPIGKRKVVIGENSERSLYGNHMIKTHAEVDALHKIESMVRCKKIKKQKMNLIVLRINKSGKLCESAPCYHCTNFLQKTQYININKLYYSRSDGTITCIKFSDFFSSTGNLGRFFPSKIKAE